MIRTLVIDPVEPSPISLRSPMGVDLDFDVAFVTPGGLPVDPTALNPQLVLTSRSMGIIGSTDIVTVDPANGQGRAEVPGATLNDLNGYRLEIYQRDGTDVPTGLLATGVLQLTGGAYAITGPLGPMTFPVLVGPPGPPGPAGHRGSIWTTGNGAPTVIGNEQDGDMYLDTSNGNVWSFSGTAWVM